jgi:hypothetical protein
VAANQESVVRYTLGYTKEYTQAFSASALFVPSDFSENVDTPALLRALCMESLSGGSISESELKRAIVCTLRNTFKVFDMEDKEFTLFVNTSDILMDFLENMIYKKSILVEKFRPEAESCIALLNNSYAAALVVYTAPGPEQIGGPNDSRKFPLLVFVMPYGILICGSKPGVCGALHFGLYEGIHTSFLGERSLWCATLWAIRRNTHKLSRREL